MTKNSFDRVASFYDLLIFITSGNYLAKSRTYLLKSIKPINSCVIIGGGTGESLLYILSNNLSVKVVFIDASEKMVSIARKKVFRKFPDKAHLVEFRAGLHNKMLKNGEKFDLVITNYFLDVFEDRDVRANIKLIKNHLREEGCWLCTDFYNSGFKVSKYIIFNLIIRSLYLFFYVLGSLKVKKLPQIPNNMQKEGLYSVNTAYFLHGLLRSDIWKKCKN